MYDAIIDAASDEHENFFPWWKLWWKAVPAKVSTFSWKTVHEKLATKDNLLKRGISDDVEAYVCSMCMGPLESSNHFLFSFLMALLIWQAVVIWLDKSMLYSSSARDHCVEFVKSEISKVKRKVVLMLSSML